MVYQVFLVSQNEYPSVSRFNLTLGSKKFAVELVSPNEEIYVSVKGKIQDAAAYYNAQALNRAPIALDVVGPPASISTVRSLMIEIDPASVATEEDAEQAELLTSKGQSETSTAIDTSENTGADVSDDQIKPQTISMEVHERKEIAFAPDEGSDKASAFIAFESMGAQRRLDRKASLLPN